ncbi:MAG: flagellar filament protein FlaA [Spirochaetales bacterium]|nr:MAG: flagellar filament protein FlaA [Spirochaetales bacterium]
MRAPRLIVAIILILTAGFAAWGQAAGAVGEPDPNSIGIDSAQQNLKEISISKFEDAGFWEVNMSKDDGIVSLRRFEGSPLDKKPLPGEEESNIQENDKYVLGVKVNYFYRGHKNIAITPSRPIPVEGICKTISVWVIGRNFNHTLKLLVEDYFGTKAEITMGKLNFSGWKKLTVAIPTNIRQKDYHYSTYSGLRFNGFLIQTDPAESYGQYYIYFDDLRAVTDLFGEESRDADDLPDSW